MGHATKTDLFDLIPKDLFVPLGSPNRIVYWDCLSRIHAAMSGQLSYSIERELLIDELQYYFDQASAAFVDEEGFDTLSSRDKAANMLRRLEKYGWIETESARDYTRKVSLPDHSVRILRTLLEVTGGQKKEYQGYIFTIYSLVRDTKDKPGVILLQIRENIESLISELKNLNANIKHYIDGLTEYKTVADIMNVLFNDYRVNVVDRSYHRLVTSDNVHAYRPAIIECLEAMGHDGDFIEKASREIAEIQEVSESQAKEAVYAYLSEIITAFREMDSILEEINTKNAQYQKAAVSRAKFKLADGADVVGQLRDILSEAGRVMEGMDLASSYNFELFDQLIRICRSGFLDSNSFYKPIEGKKEFLPEPLVAPDTDKQARKASRERYMERVANMITFTKVEKYVVDHLGDRDNMMASDLPLETTADFIMLIYIRCYGMRNRIRYHIDPQKTVTKNGYRFRDFKIIRR